jgi:hypothetical protein
MTPGAHTRETTAPGISEEARMHEASLAVAIGAVLIAAFFWWLRREDGNQRKREAEEGLKRSAQTWKERHR